MEISGVIVKAFALIILLLVFVVIVNMFVPFFKKLEINNLGREYINLMEVENGLAESDKAEIVSRLTGKGFTNINVTCTLKGTAVFGQTNLLDIKTEYEILQFGIFSFTKTNIPINYHHEFRVKRIEE